ncbi:MAG: DUF72 domain-containing protein [Promethearchaeota archaeon]
MGSKSSWYIGTCGWSYKPDWDTVFYPPSLPQKKFLEFYSRVFNSVEIDSSFYRLPSKSSVLDWTQKTPSYFKFSVKLNKEITHGSKLDLSKCKSSLLQYFDTFSPMEEQHKLLAHLVQLPPSFTYKAHRKDLDAFLAFWTEWRESKGKDLLQEKFRPNSWQNIVEFRNTSWLRPEVFELLRDYNTGYCAVIEPLLPPRFDITANDMFYLRFHGLGKDPWWNYKFNKQELTHWATELQNLARTNPNTTIVGYFNNHYSGNAVKNALDILPMLGLSPQNPIETVRDESLAKLGLNPSKNSLDKWLSTNKGK